jgi:hypothetical protein
MTHLVIFANERRASAQRWHDLWTAKFPQGILPVYRHQARVQHYARLASERRLCHMPVQLQAAILYSSGRRTCSARQPCRQQLLASYTEGKADAHCG